LPLPPLDAASFMSLFDAAVLPIFSIFAMPLLSLMTFRRRLRRFRLFLIFLSFAIEGFRATAFSRCRYFDTMMHMPQQEDCSMNSCTDTHEASHATAISLLPQSQPELSCMMMREAAQITPLRPLLAGWPEPAIESHFRQLPAEIIHDARR
jgi:hypothetical protein